MAKKNTQKHDLLHEISGGRLVGGALSQLANYSELFSRMSEGVFLLDRNSLRIMECNPAACSLLGVKEEDILGKELGQVMQVTLDLKQSKQELEWHNSKGNPFFFEVAATPLKILDYIEVIQFIIKDVTDVKRAENELKEMNDVLKKLSTTDEMTSLRNYRYFKEALESVHHQAVSFNQNYGVIFIDVDHFKKFNDRNGHPAGDQVLKGVARILKDCARTQDLSCRYGGEEFVVLCRGSSLEETQAQAEVVRRKIESTAFPFGEFQPLGKVTVSIGVAGYPASADTWQNVLESADQALYHSKEGGRNRVTLFNPTLPKKKIA